MKQWATEGLAYLTLDADVKEEVVNDPKALVAIIQAAKVQTALRAIMYTTKAFVVLKVRLKKKKCQNVKRLPRSSYFLKVKCLCIYLFIFMLQIC